MAVMPLWNYAAGDAGLAYLSSCLYYWDARGYSGAGAWLNLGTVGAAGNLTLGAATAAPAFSGAGNAAKFTFDGINDYMISGAGFSQLDVPNTNTTSFTAGVIVKQTATKNVSFLDKRDATGHSWALYDTSAVNYIPGSFMSDTVNVPVATGPAGASGAMDLYCMILNGPTFRLSTSTNSVVGALTVDNRSGTSANTDALYVGTNRALANFLGFELYGAFVDNRIPTVANQLAIMAHWGF